MALSYSAIGQVDVPEGVVGRSDQPTNLSLRVVDITLATVTDYSSGLSLVGSNVPGMNQIVGVAGVEVRGSTTASVIKGLAGAYNVVTSKVQLYKQGGATTRSLLEVVASDDLADGDKVRCFVVGW